MKRFPCFVTGEAVDSERRRTVSNPFNGEAIGEVSLVSREVTERAIDSALAHTSRLTRFERYEILENARRRIEEERESFAQSITAESGLCLRETRYEVGRTLDVLRFAAHEALRDDGRVFSCDVSPQGKARKIFTTRDPLAVVAAITPFNHPLNQVVHKVAPAIAAGTPMILKPSEKTPLTALRFAEVLYSAGLPGPMLSVLLGEHQDVAEVLVEDPRVEAVFFTGSVNIGKRIASRAGYKRVILELGGNDPLIVLEDADLELAAHLAAEGAFRNSGQRCTAVKRILVHASVAKEFESLLVGRAAEYLSGDPADPQTRVGTVIDEPAALRLEQLLEAAIRAGARLGTGGQRHGALFTPAVVADVPRDCEMVTCETFGPIAPIIAVRDFDDAIALANGTSYGLSAGVVTRRMDYALEAVKRLRAGTVNINEVPGFRIESSPFGGIKDSGLGIKEGVIEAIKACTFEKTFSLPW